MGGVDPSKWGLTAANRSRGVHRLTASIGLAAHVGGRQLIALLDRRAGRWDDAVRNLKKAIALDPQYARAFCNRGSIHSELENYDQAIHLNPGYAGAFYQRGVTYSRQHQYGRAIEDFDQAIELTTGKADKEKVGDKVEDKAEDKAKDGDQVKENGDNTALSVEPKSTDTRRNNSWWSAVCESRSCS